MIHCKTEIIVKEKTAFQVFDWIVNLDQEKYLKWHQDHIKYEIRKPGVSYVGSVVYYEQKLNGAGANFSWKVVEVIEDKYLLYKAQFIYPIRLAISLKDVENGVEVIHDLMLGFENKVVTKVLDGVVERYIFPEQAQKASDEHTRKEFKNLEKLIE